jgi:hypothetical protein
MGRFSTTKKGRHEAAFDISSAELRLNDTVHRTNSHAVLAVGLIVALVAGIGIDDVNVALGN